MGRACGLARSMSREPNGAHDSVDRTAGRVVAPSRCRGEGYFSRTFVLHLVIPPPRGGCEGCVMKNRTNQTLSALASSTRLNRGTRSLAPQAGTNHGKTASPIRQSYHGVMCDVMVRDDVIPILTSEPAIPPIPGPFSPARSPRLLARLGQLDRRPRLELGRRSSGSCRWPSSSAAGGLKQAHAFAAKAAVHAGAPGR